MRERTDHQLTGGAEGFTEADIRCQTDLFVKRTPFFCTSSVVNFLLFLRLFSSLQVTLR